MKERTAGIRPGVAFGERRARGLLREFSGEKSEVFADFRHRLGPQLPFRKRDLSFLLDLYLRVFEVW